MIPNEWTNIWISEVYSALHCTRYYARANVDDDFLKERWELSVSFLRCLSNIKLPALALLVSFYASARRTTARYYWKLIFFFSFFSLCKSSVVLSLLSQRRTSEDNDDALICSTPPTLAAVRLAECMCLYVYVNSRLASDMYLYIYI
jgi:hypothetical protein